MLKKTITYEDLDGNQVTEDFYFNLSKSELVKWEASVNGGITKMLQDTIASEDNAKIIALFEEVILMTYGQRDPDGKRFAKSPEISTAFSQTNAYDVLFLELLGSEKAAAEFIRALMPADLMAQVAAEAAKVGTPTDETPVLPAAQPVDTTPTQKQLIEMSAEELQAELERRKAQG